MNIDDENWPADLSCIPVVERMNYLVGSAVKYLWGQPTLADLRTAAWYIAREIARREETEPPAPTPPPAATWWLPSVVAAAPPAAPPAPPPAEPAPTAPPAPPELAPRKRGRPKKLEFGAPPANPRKKAREAIAAREAETEALWGPIENGLVKHLLCDGTGKVDDPKFAHGKTRCYPCGGEGFRRVNGRAYAPRAPAAEASTP